MFREKYQQTMADRHEARLRNSEEVNFREYKDRGYQASLYEGLVFHVVGHRSKPVGEILKTGQVVWLADKKICGEIDERGNFSFYPDARGWGYPKKQGVNNG